MIIDRPRLDSVATKALNASVQFWFAVAVMGQWFFAYYILMLYGGAGLEGDIARWNARLPHGYESGNTLGNVFLIAHLLLAFVITVGGPLQFIPKIRSLFPKFHSWNGRIYIFTAFAIAIDGIYLGWSGRTLVGDTTQHIGITVNAVLIILFAAMALRYAILRKFVVHRRWALRLFLAVSGVWFFRIGLMFWFTVHGGAAVGFDPVTFSGPFLTILGFAVYVFFPLGILELYLRLEKNGGVFSRMSFAMSLLVLTLAMGVGIFSTIVGMWLPLI